jgi:hypothetical protein
MKREQKEKIKKVLRSIAKVWKKLFGKKCCD